MKTFIFQIIEQLKHPLPLAAFALATVALLASRVSAPKLKARLQLGSIVLAFIVVVGALVLAFNQKPPPEPPPDSKLPVMTTQTPSPSVTINLPPSLTGGIDPLRCTQTTAADGRIRFECEGVTPPAVEFLNRQLSDRSEALDKQIRDAEEYARRFELLVARLREQAQHDKTAEETKRQVEQANYPQAVGLTDQAIDQGGLSPEIIAARYFERARIRLLNFDSLGALPDLRKAHELQPENADYALELAKVEGDQTKVEREQKFYEFKVFYATDRMQSKSNTESKENLDYSGERNKTGTLDFGVTKVSIPHGHQVGEIERPRWWKIEFQENPIKHIVLLSIERFDESKFKNQLRQQMEEMSLRSVLVFVHGYNTTFQDGILRTAQIAYDLQFPGVPILYSWPSHGESDKYTADEAAAEWTTPHFLEFLQLILAETGAQTVHLIAHSMGNRPLINALRDFDMKWLSAGAATLHNVVFAAPDFDAGTFAQLAQHFNKCAKHITLYASSNDKALLYSGKIHGYPRAGYFGDDIVVINGIDTIDASAVATDFIGHAYFGDRRSIISDLYNLIKNDLPPERRHGLEQKIKNGKQYWVLLP